MNFPNSAVPHLKQTAVFRQPCLNLKVLPIPELLRDPMTVFPATLKILICFAIRGYYHVTFWEKKHLLLLICISTSAYPAYRQSTSLLECLNSNYVQYSIDNLRLIWYFCDVLCKTISHFQNSISFDLLQQRTQKKIKESHGHSVKNIWHKCITTWLYKKNCKETYSTIAPNVTISTVQTTWLVSITFSLIRNF